MCGDLWTNRVTLGVNFRVSSALALPGSAPSCWEWYGKGRSWSSFFWLPKNSDRHLKIANFWSFFLVARREIQIVKLTYRCKVKWSCVWDCSVWRPSELHFDRDIFFNLKINVAWSTETNSVLLVDIRGLEITESLPNELSINYNIITAF